MKKSRLIIDAVGQVCAVGSRAILSEHRLKPIVRARFIAATLLREKTNMSYPDLGRVLDRDHTSVLGAVRRAQELRKKDPEFEKLFMECEETVSCLLCPAKFIRSPYSTNSTEVPSHVGQ